MDLPSSMLLPLLLRFACILHLALAFAHALLRLRYAARHRGTQATTAGEMASPPVVDVLVPCYNEDPDVLKRCLAALASQDYPGTLRVFVVDDASVNRAALLPVFHHFNKLPGWCLRLLDENRGKRRALDSVLWLGDGDVVVTVDSDTIVLPDGISHIIRPFVDERVGAVSANLRALNWDDNLLTDLINRYYWLLFEQERRAQSFFRAVLCCNGGLSAFRRVALEEIWREHLNQTVAGRQCTTGDDLHRTLQLLACGYDAVIEPAAKAYTKVPATLYQYARQQLRWSRSFFRELPLATRVFARRHSYLALDLTYQAVTPLLACAVALLWAGESITLGPAWLVGDLPMILMTLSASAALQVLRTRDLKYLLYGLVYLSVVLPCTLRALVTPAHDGWKTRDLPRDQDIALPPAARRVRGYLRG